MDSLSIPWGLPAFDDIFGPLRRGLLHLVWDQTGYAGSALAETIAREASEHLGLPVAFLSSLPLESRRPLHPVQGVFRDSLVRLEERLYWGDIGHQNTRTLRARLMGLRPVPALTVVDDLNGIVATRHPIPDLAAIAREMQCAVLLIARSAADEPATCWKPVTQPGGGAPIDLLTAAALLISLKEDGPQESFEQAPARIRATWNGREHPAAEFLVGGDLLAYKDEAAYRSHVRLR